MTETMDERMMDVALEEARRAGAAGEVPVGAVLVRDGAVLARAHNRPVALHDPTAHAEVLVVRAAASMAGNYRLPGTTLYVTLEPCIMCAGMLLQARIARLVFGAADPKGGAAVSLYRLLEDARLNHRVAVIGGVRAAACAELLSGFFREKRVDSAAHSRDAG